jgi:hypothetical protein
VRWGTTPSGATRGHRGGKSVGMPPQCTANRWGMPPQCTIKAASASSMRSRPSKRAGRSGEREWGLVDVGCEVDEGRDRTHWRKRLRRARRGSRHYYKKYL